VKKCGTILYFSIAAGVFAGWLYLGFTYEFTDTLGILFLALLWVFVALAMKVSSAVTNRNDCEIAVEHSQNLVFGVYCFEPNHSLSTSIESSPAFSRSGANGA
jgi:hypothetical protein